MKKFFTLSAIALFFLLAILQIGVSSCTKEVTTHDTIIVVQKDTVVQIKIDTIRLVKNIVPVVSAGGDTTIHVTAASDSIRLSGAATDPDDQIVSFLWSQVSGPNTALITDPGSALTYATKLASGTYIFQLMVVDSDGAVGVKRVTINIAVPQTYTITLQPNGTEGQDAIVAVRATDGGTVATANHSAIPEFSMSQWTYNAQGAGEGTNRTYLKFTALSTIPAQAEIISAKLSLYGLSQQETAQSAATPQGNSFYSGSPYTASNPAWIKRVTGSDWDEATITWMNKPATTDVHQVAIPASTAQFNYNVINLDITNLVKDILNSQQNYGFCLQLQTEQIYRSLVFASSEFSDAAKRPKLVVQYRF